MSNAPFRPIDLETASDGGSKFLGFVKCGIVDYADKSDLYDWADVYLEVTLKIEGSQYPNIMKVLGSYDKEPDGTIKTCSLLKKVYRLFDVLDFKGGPDVNGQMVDETGKPISNIATYLNQNHLASNPLEPDMKYYAYVYKEQGKKDPSKVYTTTYPRLTLNNEKGRAELESFVDFLKSKNLIKEATVGMTNSQNEVTPNNGVIAGNRTSF